MDNTLSPLVNKVEKSGLIVIDLDEFRFKGPIEEFDLKPLLIRESMFMEQPFRQALKQISWNNYQDKTVTVTCSADALIPMWAYMLVASYLQPVAQQVLFGNKEDALRQLMLQNIRSMQTDKYHNERVILKGCGKQPIPAEAYFLASLLLLPVVKSLMYGEPCSTVPVFKKKEADD